MPQKQDSSKKIDQPRRAIDQAWFNHVWGALYSEVLNEGLKISASKLPSGAVRIETYSERGYWVFKTRFMRHRYNLGPENICMFRVSYQ